MHNRSIPVEINLTSNDVILGVRDQNHPLPVYLKYGVPVTLATDDEGVSRTHLTEEYRRAVLSYHLNYGDLKRIVRNGIQFSFLPGPSYWNDNTYSHVTPECRKGMGSNSCVQFLQSSEKARVQKDLEDRFRDFEAGELSRLEHE
jgi:adenosine deaminase